MSETEKKTSEDILSATVAIITDRAADPIVRQAARILRRELAARSGVRFVPRAQAGLRLILAVQPGIGDEGFEIADGTPGEVRIRGNDPRGVLYGVGKWLRTVRLGRQHRQVDKRALDGAPALAAALAQQDCGR
ncbi:MAG: hypothetical protein ACOX5G_07505 [Kiritimatiellia bacterium]|jgi:hypothetical protein